MDEKDFKQIQFKEVSSFVHKWYNSVQEGWSKNIRFYNSEALTGKKSGEKLFDVIRK